jgi:hypothetical protein
VILSTEAAATVKLAAAAALAEEIATATGESATATPPRKKTKAISEPQKCSSWSALIGKKKAMASLGTQRAALDSNHDLDLDLDLDLDRELDSPTATAAPATALGMAEGWLKI